MPLRLLRRVLLTSALAITFLVCLPSIARAQSIGIFQEQSLPRVDKDGKTVNKRPITLKPEGVNYQDCVDDLKIRFPLQLQSFEGNASLQVWAGLNGADCKDQRNRSSASTVCWPLGPNIPLQVNPVVDIPVRNIMAGAPPFSPLEYQKALEMGPDMCGKVDLATISVQFLYFSPGQLATPSQSKDIGVEVDTVGPAPPTGLRTEPGNGRIKIVWNNISGEGGLSVLTGVRVYCDEASSGTTTTTDDAATSEPAEASCTEVPNEPDANDPDADAGTTTVCEEAGTSTTEAGTSTPATACSSPNFGEEVIPDEKFNQQYGCGAITGNAGSSVTATSLRGQPLKNNVTYAVAVAATDAFNNVGPLSAPICEYPELTTDFWENYRKAGGDAGGGCTTSGAPMGSMTAMASIGLVALSALRRRWTARRNRR